MENLEFKQSASHKHLANEEQIWESNVFYARELKTIEDEMSKVATDVYGKDHANTDFSRGFDQIATDIKASYLAQKHPLPAYANSVNTLKTECPSKSKIFSFSVGFWIALLAEIVVMIVQGMLSGDFNPFVIVLGIILGLGGYFQGKGLGDYFYCKWKVRTNRAGSGESDSISTQNKILIVLGTLLILLVSALRASGADDMGQLLIVFFVTLFFGEAVAICEAQVVELKAKRISYLNDMEKVQQFLAYQTHNENIAKGIYREAYMNKYRAIHADGFANKSGEV